MTHFREVQRLHPAFGAISVLVSLLILPLLLAGHLRTEVVGEHLVYSLWPLASERRVPISELKSFSARQYDPIAEFGGWGQRGGPGGSALNVSGDRGVQLEWPNGHRLLLGSKRADELEAALRATGPGRRFEETQYFWQGGGAIFVVPGVLIAALVAALMLSFRLVTEVERDGLAVTLTPFHWSPRKFHFSDIASYEARSYRPIREYGGWGLRGLGKNRAINMRGDRGLQLVLKNGDRVLIGSQRAEELYAAMRLAGSRDKMSS